METGEVRKRLQHVMRLARESGDARRARVADAEAAYATFLRRVAAPLARQIADALRAERIPVTLFTPKAGLRLALEHTADDYVELALDTSGLKPQVIGRVSVRRGEDAEVTERPLVPGTPPDEVSDEALLAFFLDALVPWLR